MPALQPRNSYATPFCHGILWNMRKVRIILRHRLLGSRAAGAREFRSLRNQLAASVVSTCQTISPVMLVDLVPNEIATDVAPSLETQLPGLQELWAQTLGDPRICVAILDGPVDLTHPSLCEAALTAINLDEVTDSTAFPLSDHEPTSRASSSAATAAP